MNNKKEILFSELILYFQFPEPPIKLIFSKSLLLCMQGIFLSFHYFFALEIIKVLCI